MISYKKFSGLEASKYRSDFLRLANMNMMAEIILTHCWSPIVWKNNYARTDNFDFSDFLALDFDSPGDETLEEINRNLCDHKRIIATTKSHQKEKNGIICDRFRLIIPWDRRISSYDDYKFNYKKVLERFSWADKQCHDGARFFFPSKQILYIDRESEYVWETSEHKHTPIHNSLSTKTDKTIPAWCLNFINNGAVYNGSRNMKIYSVARELFERDFKESQVRNFLMRAPINWDGIGLETILKSAKTKAGK